MRFFSQKRAGSFLVLGCTFVSIALPLPSVASPSWTDQCKCFAGGAILGAIAGAIGGHSADKRSKSKNDCKPKIGPPGPQGDKGPSGARGPQGPAGNPGVAGGAASDGSQGADGLEGEDIGVGFPGSSACNCPRVISNTLLPITATTQGVTDSDSTWSVQILDPQRLAGSAAMDALSDPIDLSLPADQPKLTGIYSIIWQGTSTLPTRLGDVFFNGIFYQTDVRVWGPGDEFTLFVQFDGETINDEKNLTMLRRME